MCLLDLILSPVHLDVEFEDRSLALPVGGDHHRMQFGFPFRAPVYQEPADIGFWV
jgi:hypothetical protein